MPHVLLILAAAASLQAAEPSSLDSKLRAVAAEFHGDVALAARNLATGQSVAINGDKRVKTASTIKVAVMVDAFSQVKEGKLRLDDAITLTTADRVQGSGILQDMQAGMKLSLEDAITLM